jgi:chloride channel, nucleotide-sensitive, 1A
LHLADLKQTADVCLRLHHLTLAMLPTVIRSCPSAETDFEPLSEYQSQTPETFFGGKPVLYYHDEHVKAWCSVEHQARLEFFAEKGSAADLKSPSLPESAALGNDGGQHLVEANKVRVFVTSE